MLSGSQGMLMGSMNNRRSLVRIKGKDKLKQAMIAHIIFSPPRAFDLSFDNTMTQ